MKGELIKIFSAFAVVAVSFLLEGYLRRQTGMTFDFVFAVAVALSFFLNIGELAVLVFFAIITLNWQPALGSDTIFFVAAFLIVFLFNKVMPARPALSNLLLSFFGILIFYFLNGSEALFLWKIVLIGRDAFFSAIYSGIVFYFWSRVYEVKLQ